MILRLESLQKVAILIGGDEDKSTPGEVAARLWGLRDLLSHHELRLEPCLGRAREVKVSTSRLRSFFTITNHSFALIWSSTFHLSKHQPLDL